MGDFINGYPVVITTRHYQNRKHRKRRINKKWAKRYGFTTYELQPSDCMLVDGVLYMTQRCFDQLRENTLRSCEIVDDGAAGK